ncbi:MAG: amidohydrolase family protein [Chthoniobacterales bacterium]|nr:amidohydrolase family protein [Chthoniobacterales bacterium]
MKALLALTTIDLKLALRNRSVLFFNYFFPLIFFFAFGFIMKAEQGSRILQVVTMVFAIGVLGNGLFGAGMRAVQERESDVLRRFKVTPITPLPVLGASLITGVILYLPGLLLVLVLANRIFGMAVPANLLSLLVFAAVGCVAFRSLGLIIAAVVNSTQESLILIQTLFMVMLFLSSISFPISLFPEWLQIFSQFLPATYLVSGAAGILQRGESLLHNWQAVAALLMTTAVGTFIATKLFRWEKEEKLRPSAKLWVLAALLPFLLLGVYQTWSREELTKAKILARDLNRGRSWLIQNARIFVGSGEVIESGAVLIRQGKIEQVFRGAAPDARSLNAEPIDAAGKTVLPGLIDVHVHLGASGGFGADYTGFDPRKAAGRQLQAYLYSGVTAVRSAGDATDVMLDVQAAFRSGEKLGAELFLCGPLFTAEGGHGTQFAQFLPEMMRESFNAEFVRTPKTPEEARAQVDALAARGIDAIKGVLEAGAPARPFTRADVELLRAVAEQARVHNLPVSIHTGSIADVTDAVALGANSVEHGSAFEEIPQELFTAMRERGTAYDPTLSVIESFTLFGRGDTSLLQRTLVQQVTPRELLESTTAAITGDDTKAMREGIQQWPISVETAGRNLQNAWRAGVPLVTGSDAGNFLIFHGPTVQHEIELWVAAGIPPEVALQAATANAAKLLRAEDRIGTVEVGKEATLLIVDGNPLQDVRALSSISVVFMKGERVNRTDLIEKK